MGETLNKAILPDKYDNYVFDLYGTLVDIHTDEEPKEIWDNLALFYGYHRKTIKQKMRITSWIISRNG